MKANSSFREKGMDDLRENWVARDEDAELLFPRSCQGKFLGKRIVKGFFTGTAIVFFALATGRRVSSVCILHWL